MENEKITLPFRQIIPFFLLPLLSCVADPGALINQKIVNPMATTATLRVFFATNRFPSGIFAECSDAYYTTKSSGATTYASCDVNVPSKHSIGAIDVGARKDPDLFFTMGGHKSYEMDPFFSAIKNSPGDEVLLFIHGFNVKFEEAVYRTAQIAYDLKFQGQPVLYTWPAGPSDGLVDGVLLNHTYEFNQENAKNSVEHVRKFFEKLQGTGKKISVMIHSMGHQVALPALLEATSSRFIDELILNAPDYSASELREQAKELKKRAKRVTLYCSPGDNALLASKTVNKEHRAGLCTKIPEFDVINVNEVDAPVLGVGGLGHGYYSGRAIITDMMQVLLGIETEKRLFIRRSSDRHAEDYVIRR